MQLELLKQSLREFGLDPREWDLDITRRIGSLLRFEIRARGHSLCFEGWATNGSWVSLALLEEI